MLKMSIVAVITKPDSLFLLTEIFLYMRIISSHKKIPHTAPHSQKIIFESENSMMRKFFMKRKISMKRKKTDSGFSYDRDNSGVICC